MKIEVVKYRGEWKVEFSFGNQFFLLEYGGTKAEALWMSKTLAQCFKNYKHSIKSDAKTKSNK